MSEPKNTDITSCNRVWAVVVDVSGKVSSSEITPKIPPNVYKGYYSAVVKQTIADLDRLVKGEYSIVIAPSRYYAIKIAMNSKYAVRAKPKQIS